MVLDEQTGRYTSSPPPDLRQPEFVYHISRLDGDVVHNALIYSFVQIDGFYVNYEGHKWNVFKPNEEVLENDAMKRIVWNT